MTVKDVERIAEQWMTRRGVPEQDVAPAVSIRLLTTDLGALAADAMLNEIGKAYRRDQRLLKADSDLSPFEAGTSRLRDQVTAEEEQIVRGPATVDISRQAEIRAWLSGLTKQQQLAEYYAAISAGDWETVRAIRDAPSSMNVLNESSRQKGRELALAKASPEAREAIEHLTNRIAAREHVVFAARRLLKELASAE